jgi:salicylate hydroxylase
MLDGQRITVLGGGIGGFAAATALAQRGAEVSVLEQAARISEVGAGIQISPNGVAVLDALGLGDVARARAIRNNAVHLVDGITGRDVIRMDLARLRPAQTFLLFHRADLLDILHKAALAAGVTVETGARVTRVDIGQSGAFVDVEGQGLREVAFLVGADGLHSLVRKALDGARDPFFTGMVAWRALLPGTGAAPAEAVVRMGPRRHMVSYPLRDGSLTNLVAVEERKDWAEESWLIRDDPDNLRRAFAGFGPDAQALLAQAEIVHVWGLFRHPVAERWHGGPAAILGDAAHPTLPFLAQGAVMALEDAWVLAACLDSDGLVDGPAFYQARRRDRVERVIDAANNNSRNYHMSNPLAKALGFGALRLAGALRPETVLGQYDWVYDHDVTQD